MAGRLSEVSKSVPSSVAAAEGSWTTELGLRLWKVFTTLQLVRKARSWLELKSQMHTCAGGGMLLWATGWGRGWGGDDME